MYLFIKAFHLIFMVTWFAGLFYIFRLFVYHVESTEPVVREQLKIMEIKLYKFTTPLMFLNLAFGLILAFLYTEGFRTLGQHPWLYIKMLLVLLLVHYHFYCGKVLRQLKEDKCKLTGRQ